MSVKLCVLASGSGGNCIYIGNGDTQLLIDAGMSARQITARLAEIGIDVSGLHAICVSHEHSDHTVGTRVLHRRYGVELYTNSGTLEAIIRRDNRFGELPWKKFTTGSNFQVGSFRIQPFSVSHDAFDPCGFVVETPETIIGIATDLGCVTDLLRHHLKRCHAVVIEANHDPMLLKNDQKRPWRTIQRIMGRQGHLSNEAAAELLAETAAGGLLRHVFLAHLSGDCNEPELALKTVRQRLDRDGFHQITVEAACQHAVSSVWMSEPVAEPATR